MNDAEKAKKYDEIVTWLWRRVGSARLFNCFEVAMAKTMIRGLMVVGPNGEDPDGI